MSKYNLALIGFGNVGKALAVLLINKREELNSRYNINFKVTAISTNRHGLVINPDGIDLEKALASIQTNQSLEDLNPLSWRASDNTISNILENSKANVLFEMMPVNYLTGQPAVDYLATALEHGIHAISANKGPVVHAYTTLSALAKASGVKYLFESSVMDGAPIFSLFKHCLPGANLIGFKGILNSTTNLILTRMDQGETFQQALTYAQNIGIAETDPGGDIDGWDSAVKIAALVTVLMKIPFTPLQVNREGIRSITEQDIVRAHNLGERWKLICSVKIHENSVEAKVCPEMVPSSSPLFAVEGTSSLIQFETDVLSGLTIVENDPTTSTTAYGLLADFISAVGDE